MADGVRHEKLTAQEAGFLTAVERAYFSDPCRELAKKLAALPEQTAAMRVRLAIATAQDGRS